MAMKDKGQIQGTQKDKYLGPATPNDLFVLDTSIFSNVFKRDIRRVYLYKKTERLAKAITLISPAFSKSVPLQQRFEQVTISLIDAATLSPSEAKVELSKELLALSSLLSIARTSGALSHMNIDLITHEAHTLLSEIADYEEPRFSLEDSFSLAELLSESERVGGGGVSQKGPIPSPIHLSKKTPSPLSSKTKVYLKDKSRFCPL